MKRKTGHEDTNDTKRESCGLSRCQRLHSFCAPRLTPLPLYGIIEARFISGGGAAADGEEDLDREEAGNERSRVNATANTTTTPMAMVEKAIIRRRGLSGFILLLSGSTGGCNLPESTARTINACIASEAKKKKEEEKKIATMMRTT